MPVIAFDIMTVSEYQLCKSELIRLKPAGLKGREKQPVPSRTPSGLSVSDR